MEVEVGVVVGGSLYFYKTNELNYELHRTDVVLLLCCRVLHPLLDDLALGWWMRGG